MIKKLEELLGKTKERKLKSKDYSRLIEEKGLAGEKKLERIKSCGHVVRFKSNEDKTKIVLHNGYFCKTRFCPICSKIKSTRLGYELLELIAYARQENPTMQLLFLTLTVPNVKGEELKSKLENLAKSFKRLIEREEFKVIKGFIRKLEITYNEKTDTYHPHYHCLLMVNSRYFKSKEYIKRDRWLELWQSVTNDYSITQVDIRKAKFNNYDDILEMVKYTAKSNDVLRENTIEYFELSTHRKRDLNYGGILKEYRKLQKNKELILTEESRKKLGFEQIEFKRIFETRWNKENSKYVIEKEYDYEEFQEFNKKIEDETENID